MPEDAEMVRETAKRATAAHDANHTAPANPEHQAYFAARGKRLPRPEHALCIEFAKCLVCRVALLKRSIQLYLG